MDDSGSADRKLVQHDLLKLTNQLRESHGEAPATKLPEAPFCSFCHRLMNEVNGMIEGLSAHICDACAAEVWQVFRTKKQAQTD